MDAPLAALDEHGLDLTQTPLFLVFGSAGERQEKMLFDASRLSLNFREVPTGPAALHWYANADGIYLVATDTSCLSRLSRRAAEVVDKERAAPAAPRPAAGPIRGTVVVGPEPAKQVRAAVESAAVAASVPDTAGKRWSASEAGAGEPWVQCDLGRARTIDALTVRLGAAVPVRADLSADGTIWMWGKDVKNQPLKAYPVRVWDVAGINDVAAGKFYTIVLSGEKAPN